jgi:hypothetical protein
LMSAALCWATCVEKSWSCYPAATMLTSLAGAALCFALHTPLTTPAHPAVRVAVAMAAEPAAMKLKEIKAELDVLGVAWKGVHFERDELAHALMTARGAALAGSAAGTLGDAAPAVDPKLVAAAHELVWEAEEASRLAELQARAALFSASGALSPGRVLPLDIQPWP